MNIWFWISMYLLVSIYMYFTLRRLTKHKKFQWQDWLIFIFTPILIWGYPIVATPKIRKQKEKDLI